MFCYGHNESSYASVITFKCLCYNRKGPLISEQQIIRTTSPFWDCLPSVTHLWRTCKLCMYSTRNPCQNWSAKWCTCFQEELLRVSLVAKSGMSNDDVCIVFWWINKSDESSCSASGSEDTVTSGQAFNSTKFHQECNQASCVKGPFWFKSKLSKIFLEVHIIFSNAHRSERYREDKTPDTPCSPGDTFLGLGETEW